MQAGTEADIDEIGFFVARDGERPSGMAAGEVGYMITGIKDVAKLRVGDTLTAEARPAAEPLPGYREVRPMVFCGLFPIDTDRYEDLRDALDTPGAQRRRALVRAGDLAGARVRLSLRLPRPAAHGHRPRAAGARVRPRAAGDDPERRATRSRCAAASGSRSTARPRCRTPRAIEAIEEPYIRATIITPPELRRRDHGALPGPPRHPRRHALPVARAGAAPLRPAAGRDRARLLRPAQVAQPRLRVARLRADRQPARRTWSSSTCCWPATGSTRCR